MDEQNQIIGLLERFIEEEDDKALNQALQLISTTKIDIPALLDHLENFRADYASKRRVIAMVRKQLGLPIIPGPVCRRSP